MIVALLLLACGTTPAPETPPAPSESASMNAGDFAMKRRQAACEHGQRCGAKPRPCGPDPVPETQLEGCEFDLALATQCLDGWRDASCPTGDPRAWIRAQAFDRACFDALVCPVWATDREDLVPLQAEHPLPPPPRGADLSISNDAISVTGHRVIVLDEAKQLGAALLDNASCPPLEAAITRYAKDAPAVHLLADANTPASTLWFTLDAARRVGYPEVHLVARDPRPSLLNPSRWREGSVPLRAALRAPEGATLLTLQDATLPTLPSGPVALRTPANLPISALWPLLIQAENQQITLVFPGDDPQEPTGPLK